MRVRSRTPKWMGIKGCEVNRSVRQKAEKHFKNYRVQGQKMQPIRFYRLNPGDHIIATRWSGSPRQRYVKDAGVRGVPRIDVGVSILTGPKKEFKHLGGFTLNWNDEKVHFGKPVMRLPVEEWGEELVLRGTGYVQTPKGKPLLDLWRIAMEHAREIAGLKGLGRVQVWTRRKDMKEGGTSLKRHLESRYGFRFRDAEDRPDLLYGEVEV